MSDAQRDLDETRDAARAARSQQEVREDEVGRALVAAAVAGRFADVDATDD